MGFVGNVVLFAAENFVNRSRIHKVRAMVMVEPFLTECSPLSAAVLIMHAMGIVVCERIRGFTWVYMCIL